MTDIISQYYQSIVQQLRSEVDTINSLFHHQGVKGEGNEAALRELLTKFIPKRYSVGTGVVIDRNGTQSRQCDIVIYESLLYPSLLTLTNIHFFPVDIVYATIEVKTTLTSGSVKEALENIASVKNWIWYRIILQALIAEGVNFKWLSIHRQRLWDLFLDITVMLSSLKPSGNGLPRQTPVKF